MGVAAKNLKKTLPKDVAIDAKVSLNKTGDALGLSVVFDVSGSGEQVRPEGHRGRRPSDLSLQQRDARQCGREAQRRLTPEQRRSEEEEEAVEAVDSGGITLALRAFSYNSAAHLYHR